MISLIICSRKQDVSAELKENIRRTIGTEYELVVIDNSDSSKSIFSAYNEGAARATGDFFCFMHEDILYRTVDWGRNVIRSFEDETVGLIGIAGGKYLPPFPGYWFSNPDDRCINIIQHSGKGDAAVHDYVNEAAADSTDVVAVDGVWFCIRKNLFERISFDEAYYSGFHIYDLDICMQVLAAGYRCRVVYDILIEHFSIGNGGRTWLDSALRFVDKWRGSLPVKTTDFSWSPSRKKACWRALAEVLERMEAFGYPQRTIRRTALSAIPGIPLTKSRHMRRVFRSLFRH